MRKVIFSMMVSLDGYIDSNDDDLEWVIVDEELHTFINEQQAEFDTCLYGRRLYEVMSYWETADSDLSTPEYERDYARIWQTMDKVVFSQTLTEVQSKKTRLVRDDAAKEVRRLKQQPGKDMEVGGATLAASLMEAGLIDEYHLFVQPVILGGGTRFFPETADLTKLQLLETRTFDSGVVYVRYQIKEA
jgi:dihydrofolate reductase